jgi:plasmid maintenance system antidote protein VapI
MNLQTRYDLWGVENDAAALREAEQVEPALL